MVERVYETVHSVKPSARFSISPFGLYKPGDEAGGGMPDPITGLDPYSVQSSCFDINIYTTLIAANTD